MDDAGAVWQQDNDTRTFSEVGSDVGATDISIGIDGSIWVSRVDPTNDKGTSEVA